MCVFGGKSPVMQTFGLVSEGWMGDGRWWELPSHPAVCANLDLDLDSVLERRVEMGDGGR